MESRPKCSNYFSKHRKNATYWRDSCLHACMGYLGMENRLSRSIRYDIGTILATDFGKYQASHAALAHRTHTSQRRLLSPGLESHICACSEHQFTGNKRPPPTRPT